MRLPVLAGVLILMVGSSFAGPITSTFDTTSQGWTGVTLDPGTAFSPVLTNLPLTFSPAGGNPGGFVSIFDADDNDTFFSAPAAYLGNHSASFGRSLSYSFNTDAPPTWDGADVVIIGGGLVLVYDVPQTAGVDWQTRAVPLSAGIWRLSAIGGTLATNADIQNALANVTALYISAETTYGLNESPGLDNVVLDAPDTSSVPEPGFTMMTAAGLAIGLVARRRR